MNLKLALRISYFFLLLSLSAVAVEILVYFYHLSIPAACLTPLKIGAYLWPLAAYAVAVYRKKLYGT